MKSKNIYGLHKAIRKDYTLWDKFIMHPKMNWLRYTIYNLPSLPRDIYLEIKWFIQRGKRGYSDNDTWCFDEYLSRIISEGLTYLKNEEDEFIIVSPKILEDIIFTFKIEQKIIRAELIYTTERKRKLNTKISKSTDIPIMSKADCIRYHRGWKLFKEHFKSLWT